MRNQKIIDQMEEIIKMVKSKDKIPMDPTLFYFIGVYLLLIPLIYLFWVKLPLGLTPDRIRKYFLITIKIWQYLLQALCLLGIVRALLLHRKNKKQLLHPIMIKALKIIYPVIIGLFGTVIILLFLGHETILMGIAMTFVGITLYISAIFSAKEIAYIAWSYILIGLILTATYKIIPDSGWPVVSLTYAIYFALTFLLTGYFIKRNNLSS